MAALWLALLALLPAGAALAQGSDDYPLNEGDTWTFETFNNEVWSRVVSPSGLRHVVAGSDTMIAGNVYRLLAVTYTDYALAVTGRARCAARVDTGAEQIVWIALEGECGALEDGLEMQTADRSPGSFFVGGLEYQGIVLTQEALRFLAGASVGTVESYRSTSDARALRNRLLHATVGGVAYGVAPDSTAWRGFAPLSVGDRRVVQWSTNTGGGYWSTEVTGQETVGGIEYLRLVLTNYSGAAAPVPTQTRVLLQRYRDDLGCVVQREASGSEPCVTAQVGGMRSFARPGMVTVSGQTVAARVIRDGSSPGTSYTFFEVAEGLGETYYHSLNSGGPIGSGSSYNTDLRYARVGGVAIGVEPSWVTWPTAGEATPDPAARLALHLASANPTDGAVRVRVTSASPRDVRLTVTDGLGRQVVSRALTLVAGTTDVGVALQGVAPGIYRIRVIDAVGESAGLSVVRR